MLLLVITRKFFGILVLSSFIFFSKSVILEFPLEFLFFSTPESKKTY